MSVIQTKRSFYQIVNHLLGREKTSALPDYDDPLTLATTFNDFFTSKIDKIWLLLSEMETSIGPLQCPHPSTVYSLRLRGYYHLLLKLQFLKLHR